MMTKDQKMHEALKFYSTKYSKLFPFYDKAELYDEAWAGKIRKLEDTACKSHFYTCAKHSILDFIRRDFRQRRLLKVYMVQDEEGQEMNILDNLAASQKCPHRIDAELKGLLNFLVANAELSVVQKRCLFLRFYRGMEYRDIAEKIGLSRTSHSVSYTHVARAIIKLREIYNDTLETSEL